MGRVPRGAPVTLFQLRKLMLAATRDRAFLPVLSDALLETFPAEMAPAMAEADQRARRHRTAYVIVIHPNNFLTRLSRYHLPAGASWKDSINVSTFALWPAGEADRVNIRKRYHYLEVYRTPSYAKLRRKKRGAR